MYTSTVSRKGQVVIPADLRRKLKLEEGDRVAITESDGAVRIERIDEAYFERFAGILSPGASDALLDERRRDREREEKGW